MKSVSQLRQKFKAWNLLVHDTERSKQLEAAHILQEETKPIAQSQRKKIITFGAFRGEDLLTTLLAITPRPVQHIRPYIPSQKVTFSQLNQ